jgi:hypothetical protein
MWSGADLADALVIGIGRFEADTARAQAVSGIDSMDELDLHPHIADALEAAGFGVHREVQYPAARHGRNKAKGQRCDLVLTPEGLPLHDPNAAATLFDNPDAVDLESAFWLEIKTIAQFLETGANGSWSNELLSTVRDDVAKLDADDGIRHSALLIMMFAQSDEVVDHDLGVWQDRCLSQGFPIGAPWMRRVPLLDRLGNTVCRLAIYPVH